MVPWARIALCVILLGTPLGILRNASQVGFGLLRVSLSSAPVHLAQLTPPLLTNHLFEQFDDRMAECGFELLKLPGQSEPVYSEERSDSE